MQIAMEVTDNAPNGPAVVYKINAKPVSRETFMELYECFEQKSLCDYTRRTENGWITVWDT